MNTKPWGAADSRITDPVSIDPERVEAIIDAGRMPTIQFSRPGYSQELLRAVDDLCAHLGHGLEVRFYGHHLAPFDAAVLAAIPHVRRLSVDCLSAIVNEQMIADLSALQSLSFGVYWFDNPNFLAGLNLANLRRLRLSETAKRNFDLGPLTAAKCLEALLVEGHTRSIDSLAHLGALQTLTLRAIPKNCDLSFVGRIESLKALKFILGGRASFNEISHPQLENLEVVWVRGLETIGPLERFPNLRSLIIEDQPRLSAIDLAGAPLQYVMLNNCKTLNEIGGLDDLDQLVEIRISRTKLDLDVLATRKWPATMKVVALYSPSLKRNAALRALLDGRGYAERTKWPKPKFG